jgi:hypothetical protein
MWLQRDEFSPFHRSRDRKPSLKARAGSTCQATNFQPQGVFAQALRKQQLQAAIA